MRAGIIKMCLFALLFVVIWIMLPYMVKDAFVFDMINVALINSVAVGGMVLLFGLCGQMSLGQNGFFALGAYGVAVATVRLGWPTWAGFLLGMTLTVICALLVGMSASRIRGVYLAITTLAFGYIVYSLPYSFLSWSGGSDGLYGIPALKIGIWVLDTPQKFFAFILPFSIFVCMLLYNITRETPHSRVMKAIHVNEDASKSLGVPVSRIKVEVFLIAAVLAGLSGFLYVNFHTGVAPQVIGLNLSIDYLFMLFLGGITSIWGGFFGSLFVQVLPSMLGFLAGYRSVIIGLLFLLILFYLPGGISGLVSGFVKAITRRFGPQHINGLKTKESRPSNSIVHFLPISKQHVQTGEKLLEVRSLTKNFGGLVAVEDVDFEIHAGEVKGVIGPNGSGKTTMFNMVTGTFSPTKGSVSFLGQDITGKKPHQIAKMGMARTFQNLKLFDNMTVLDNVLMGMYLRSNKNWLDSAFRTKRLKKREMELKQEAEGWLYFVGLWEKRNEMSAKLSYGNRKMLELARALALQPVLICLDEPAAGLNEVEREQLLQMLLKLKRNGLSMMVVEHNVQFISRLADSILVLWNGKPIIEGDAQQVFANEQVKSAYLG